MSKSFVKKIFFIFKIVVVLASYGFVTYRFYVDDNLQNILMGRFISTSILYFIIACFFMPVNWLLESYKWKLLLSRTEEVSWNKAFFSILAGLSIAIFTPNRIGEYVGRIWVLENRNRPTGVAVTIAGSLAQSTITFFVGVICGWFFYNRKYNFKYLNLSGLVFVSFIVLIGLVFVFFLPYLSRLMLRFRMHRYFERAFKGLSILTYSIIAKVLLISLLRYIVFTIQFVLLLHFFDAGLSISECVMGIGLLYASMLLIPTVAVAEPGVRGSLSLLIFGVFSLNSTGILAASLTLWVINLVVPALVGALYLSAIKTHKI